MSQNTPGFLGSTTDVATGTGATATVTYAAVPSAAHVISGVGWSFSAAPAAAASLVITDGANTIFNLDVTAAGPGFLPFPVPKAGTAGNAMTVVLGSGAGAVVGKVSVLSHWTA